MVLGARGEYVGNLLMGSTTLQLVGHAPCPVVVVAHPAAGHHRVVVGTDGSPDSTRAVAHAFDEASLRGAHVRVVSALGLPQGWPRHLLSSAAARRRGGGRRRRQVEDQVAPLRERTPTSRSRSTSTGSTPSRCSPTPRTGPTSWSWAHAAEAASTVWPSDR